MNGAVHGDAIATASTPDANAFADRLASDHVAIRDGSNAPNSNTPDRFSAITKNTTASVVTTAGDCNWNPHPNCSPAARNARIAAPSAAKETMTPAPKATPSRLDALRSSRACDASVSALSDSTGNT